MTTAKRNGASQEQTLALVIRDSANQIWLAGLGAYARAEEEGSRLFDSLVALGERVENRARDQVFRPIRAAEKKAGEVKSSANGVFEKVQKVFERRIARMLNGLQIPTSRDVNELAQRVEELTVELERLQRRAGGAKTSGAAAKPAVKASAPKTSTRKRVAKPSTKPKPATRARSSSRRAATRKTDARSGSSRA